MKIYAFRGYIRTKQYAQFGFFISELFHNLLLFQVTQATMHDSDLSGSESQVFL